MTEDLMDEAAQKLYLSALVGTPGLYARVHHLIQPAYFDTEFQRGITFLKAFFDTERAVPAIEIFNAATKLNLEKVTLEKNQLRFVAEHVANFCRFRAVIQEVLRAPERISSGDLGRLVADITRATQIQLHTELGIDYFANVTARLDHAEASEKKLSTGWEDVDELCGGIGRQELILFTANSGVGKSVGMLNLAFNLLKQGLNGVYISLEMKDSLVAARLDSMISRISGRDLAVNKLRVGESIEAFKESVAHGRFFVKRMRENTTTANDILSYLRELESAEGFKPDFVVVDYLDLMQSVSKHSGDNMFTKDKLVAEEVRAIGFDLDAIMISASQLGRGAITATREGESIGQDHIQGGISKINTADLVIAIVRDEAMQAANECRFDFLKARNSPAAGKRVLLKSDPITYLITDYNKSLSIRPKSPSLKVSTPKNDDPLNSLIMMNT